WDFPLGARCAEQPWGASQNTQEAGLSGRRLLARLGALQVPMDARSKLSPRLGEPPTQRASKILSRQRREEKAQCGAHEHSHREASDSGRGPVATPHAP